LDFILHIPYVVDACALSSILPSLFLTDMIYCTPDKETTSASVQGLYVDFRLIWVLLLHIVLKHVQNSTARFRCAFCSTDGPAYGSAPTASHLNCKKFP